MAATDDNKLKAGDVVGVYTVLDPTGFGGKLPTAVINEPHPNAGIRVILPSAHRKEAIDAGSDPAS